MRQRTGWKHYDIPHSTGPCEPKKVEVVLEHAANVVAVLVVAEHLVTVFEQIYELICMKSMKRAEDRCVCMNWQWCDRMGGQRTVVYSTRTGDNKQAAFRRRCELSPAPRGRSAAWTMKW